MSRYELNLIPDPQNLRVWDNFRRIMDWVRNYLALYLDEIDGGGP